MKQIIAVIQPFLAEKLIQVVSEMNVDEISIRDVKGYGRQKNYLDRYGDSEFSLAFVPKVEVSVWVCEEEFEYVLGKMSQIARTGRLGDGKLFVVPVDQQISLG